MTELLVSVRCPREASAALAGGASIVDVKDPSRGSLGRAEDTTIAAVVRSLAARCPVSAAMGELMEGFPGFAGPGLTYLKWGLAGCGRQAHWPEDLAKASARVQSVSACCQVVAVAYADWRRADSPRPEEVCAFACAHPCGAFLLDTWHKDGTTLVDWLTPAQVGRLCRRCRDAGVRVAVAGSLGAAQIALLRASEPDWFAVRGAVCKDGRRGLAVDRRAVRLLANLLGSPQPAKFSDGN